MSFLAGIATVRWLGERLSDRPGEAAAPQVVERLNAPDAVTGYSARPAAAGAAGPSRRWSGSAWAAKPARIASRRIVATAAAPEGSPWIPLHGV